MLNDCERLGGMCAPAGSAPTPTVSCDVGYAAIPGSETGFGGYRQLGCGDTEAGPLACCVPTFPCGEVECPVIGLCVTGGDGARCTPGERPAECNGLSSCGGSCDAAQRACLDVVCGPGVEGAIERGGADVRCELP
jgi:hypothetical protein